MPDQIPAVIALYSSVPRSGKSTTAEYLCERYGYVRLPFAEPIKIMIQSLLTTAGLPRDRVLYFTEKAKEEIIPGLDASYRKLATTQGTEWGRQQISPDFWIKVWQLRYQALLAHDPAARAVVDDCRFANELDHLEDFAVGDFRAWHIIRDQAPPLSASAARGHASEGGLDDYPFHRYIPNSGSFEELYEEIASCLSTPVPA